MMKINWLGIIIIFVVYAFAMAWPRKSAPRYGKLKITSYEAPVPFHEYNRNDKINMSFTFRNQPEGSYKYTVLYQLSTTQKNVSGELNPENNYTIPIKGHMQKEKVRISVTLYDLNNENCSTNLIFDGKENPRNRDGPCFNLNACSVSTNFPEKCTKGQVGFNINCTSSEGSYKCSSEKTSVKTKSYLNWYQYYSDGTIIGNVSIPNTNKSYFSFKLEDFDYNSYINSTISSDVINNAPVLMKSNVHQIIIPKNEKIYSYAYKAKYSENKLFVFSCAQYWGNNNIKVQVAVIDTSTNMLKSLFMDAVNMTKRDTQLDGKILCCLMYEAKNLGIDGYRIERKVENKTLLVYEPGEIQKELSLFYPIITTVTLIFLILAVTVIIIFKKLRKKRESLRTLELDTYACPERIVYAELNVNQDSRQPLNLNESPYAEIAGVLESKRVQLFR